MKQIILITGGAGDIAQSIAQVLGKTYSVWTPSKEELDVTDEYNIRTYFEAIKPDILINAAGYIVPQPIKELDAWDVYKQLDINLMGAILCSKYATLNKIQLIINIGSSAGLHGKKDWSIYCIAKAGLVMLTECLNAEGTNSVILSIGRTDTKMRSKLFPNEDKSTLLTPLEVADEIYKLICLADYTNYKKYFLYKKGGELCLEVS